MIILVVAHPGVLGHPQEMWIYSQKLSTFLTIVEIHTGSVELFSLHQVAVAISFRWYKGPISKHLLVNLLLLCTKKTLSNRQKIAISQIMF